MIFTVASKYSFPVFFNGKPSYIKFWKPLFCFKIYFPPSPPSPFMHSIALPFFFPQDVWPEFHQSTAYI